MQILFAGLADTGWTELLTAEDERCVFSTGEAALDAAAHRFPDLVISSLCLPDMDCEEFSRRLFALCPGVLWAVCDAASDSAAVRRTVRAGACRFLPVPDTEGEWAELIAYARRTSPEPEKLQRTILRQQKTIRAFFLRDILNQVYFSERAKHSEALLSLWRDGTFWITLYYVPCTVREDMQVIPLDRVQTESLSSFLDDRIPHYAGFDVGIFHAFAYENEPEAETVSEAMEDASKIYRRELIYKTYFVSIGRDQHSVQNTVADFTGYVFWGGSVRRQKPDFSWRRLLTESEEALQAVLLGGEPAELFTKNLGAILLKNGAGRETASAFFAALLDRAVRVREYKAPGGREMPLMPELMQLKDQLRFTELFLSACQRELSAKTLSVAKTARLYLEEHFGEPELTLQAVAQHLFVNYTYLCEEFKRENGMNFSGYLTQYRLNKAYVLLKTTSLSAAEISELVGYRDVRTFYRNFRRLYGCTPSDIRRNLTPDPIL